MAGSLRDDLASLKINRDRRDSKNPSPVVTDWTEGRARGEGGIRFFSFLLWLIPLGLFAGAGVFVYRQYDQLRAKPEVAVGLVQAMTSGEAEKLLSAKG
jgi:hypothetical protein